MKENLPGTRCAVCSFDQHGNCTADFEGKPYWTVSQQRLGDCDEIRSVMLNISSVSDDDDGLTVFCGYYVHAQNMDVLAEFDVTVTDDAFHWQLFILCGVIGSILAFTLITSLIAYMWYISQSRRKRKRKSRNKRRGRRSKRMKNIQANVEDSGE